MDKDKKYCCCKALCDCSASYSLQGIQTCSIIYLLGVSACPFCPKEFIFSVVSKVINENEIGDMRITLEGSVLGLNYSPFMLRMPQVVYMWI